MIRNLYRLCLPPPITSLVCKDLQEVDAMLRKAGTVLPPESFCAADGQLYFDFYAEVCIGTMARDVRELFLETEANARAGDLDSQRILGHCFYSGFGTPKNTACAYKWFWHAAWRGDVEAQYWYACYRLQDNQIPCDPAEMLALMEEAANNGLLRAQCTLGLAYTGSLNRRVEKNDALAEKWLLQAAEGGLASAQYNLAIFYSLTGDESKADVVRYWIQQSAEQGNPEAIEFLRRVAILEENEGA